MQQPLVDISVVLETDTTEEVEGVTKEEVGKDILPIPSPKDEEAEKDEQNDATYDNVNGIPKPEESADAETSVTGSTVQEASNDDRQDMGVNEPNNEKGQAEKDAEVSQVSPSNKLGESANAPQINEDQGGRLAGLVDIILGFGKKLEQGNDDEEEEEGAIEEDEVPFERVPEKETNSPIVHLMNIPPEFNLEALASELGNMTDIVHHCYVVNTTQLKIVFVTVALAKEAKKALDFKRLSNRTIQAVLSSKDDWKDELRQGRMNKYNGYNTPLPSFPWPPAPPSKGGRRPVPPMPPGFPLPPLPGGVMPHMSPGTLPHRGMSTLHSMQPINMEPRDGVTMGALPSGYQDINNSDRQFHSIFGRNVSRREGKSLYDYIQEMPQVSHWEQEQTLSEQQRHYDDINAEFGISNRYLVLGGLPDIATESISKAFDWVFEYTKKKAEIEICRMEEYAKERSCNKDLFLHLTFQKRADCAEVYTYITNHFPAILCRYAAPRKALDTLWLGNMNDAFTYCRDELEIKDMCSMFGELRSFRFAPEKYCCFVTYIRIEDAIKARNRLLGMCFTPMKSLAINVDFTIDTGAAFVKRSNYHTPDMRPRARNDLPHKLGERVLSALQRRPDGNAVIRNILEGKDRDATGLFDRPRHRQFYHDHYDPPRHMERPLPPRMHSSSYGRNPWSRNRKRYNSPGAAPSHEYHKHRKLGNGYDDTFVDDSAYTKRGHQEELPAPPSPPKVLEPTPKSRVKVERPRPEVKEPPKPKVAKSYMCDLLKRGKPICKVSALFVRGDASHRIPQTLDVNQRANPERLANYLNKGTELSLWKLGAENNEDMVKYDGLCEYLISKNRVALVQDGPYEIYIVPPSETYSMIPGLPDTKFMYAYVLPKGT